MLTLSTIKREPFWLDAGKVQPPRIPVPGLRVQVRPVSLAMIIAARGAGAAAMKAAMETKNPDFLVAGDVAFTASICRAGIVAWEGVGDAEGKVTEPSPENIDAILEDWRVYDFLDREYVSPGLVRADEKNASSPSRTGTTGEKIPVKRSASTARKRARNVPTS
jgi:hypothetical protein